MKRIWIVLLFALTCAWSNAQNWIPLPTDSTAYWSEYSWAVYVFPQPLNCQTQFLYRPAGDTIINAQSYTKFIQEGEICLQGNPYYKGALRQDSAARKIYIVLPNDSIEKILYDFSQVAGDTVNSILTDQYGPAVVDTVDSVMLDGVYHRCLKLSTLTTFSRPAEFIEGVGSTFGLFDPLFEFESGQYLVCAHDNGMVIWPDTASDCSDSVYSTYAIDEHGEQLNARLYPNPVTGGSFEIRFGEKAGEAIIQVYDMLSREIACYLIRNADMLSISNPAIRKGVFIVKISTDKGIYSAYKIIAE